MSISDWGNVLVVLAGVVPALIIGGAVIWSDTHKSRAHTEAQLNLVLRAERAEKRVEDVMEWARLNNHGVTPSIKAAPPLESPASFRIWRLRNPLSFRILSGWFLVRIDSNQEYLMKAEEWEGSELVVRRMEQAELKCVQLERKLARIRGEWKPRYLVG